MTEKMTMAQLEKITPGKYRLKGKLNFNSVPELWAANTSVNSKNDDGNKNAALFADESNTLDIDLSQLERSDSSGLAMLVEWYREAEQQNKKITFINLPVQMYDIARVTGLDEILPLEKRN